MSNKIIIPAERAFIIRSVKTRPNGETETRYYEAPSMWNRSPMEAVLFQNYESAEGHLSLYRKRDMPVGMIWADGSTEVIDVVPLYGEILTSPNGKRIDPNGHNPDA